MDDGYEPIFIYMSNRPNFELSYGVNYQPTLHQLHL